MVRFRGSALRDRISQTIFSLLRPLDDGGGSTVLLSREFNQPYKLSSGVRKL